MEQNDTKVPADPGRNSAIWRRSAPIFRLAHATLTCSQFPLLLRADRRHAAGVAISLHPHLLPPGCAVPGPRGDYSPRQWAFLAGTIRVDGRGDGGCDGAVKLRSYCDNAGARLHGRSDCAFRRDAVRAIGHRNGSMPRS